MKCKECGAKISKGINFCSKCGNRVNKPKHYRKLAMILIASFLASISVIIMLTFPSLKYSEQAPEESYAPDKEKKTQADNRVKEVSLGLRHSAAVTYDGRLYVWGQNLYGQIGDGTTMERNAPVKIMENIKSVSLGGRHSAAITEDGSLYLWGDNVYGELGDGTQTASYLPIKILDHVTSVSLGTYHSAAITEDGSLYLWGDNFHGEIGDGTNSNRYEPVKIMDHVMQVSLGDGFSAAITEDGSLYLWGDNDYNKLGVGINDGFYTSTTPVKIMDHVRYVALGADYGASITDDNVLYMWGNNYYVQAGIRYPEFSWSSSPVPILENVEKVCLGHDHSGVIVDSSLYMCGWNTDGQIGITGKEITSGGTELSETLQDVADISMGGLHSAAVLKDGSLYLWGDNLCGQIGNADAGHCDVMEPIKIEFPLQDNSRLAEQEDNHPVTLTFDDLKGYWERRGQSYHIYEFFEDGTWQGTAAFDISPLTDAYVHDQPADCVGTYEIVGDEVIMYGHNKGTGNTYRIQLKAITKKEHMEWELVHLDKLKETDKLLYETDFINDAMDGNTFGLVKRQLDSENGSI